MNESNTATSEKISALRQKYGQIHFGIDPAHLRERLAKMDALMKEWDPVGASYDELVRLLGPPTNQGTHERPNAVGYAIDSGLNGALYYFYLEKGRVVRWQSVSIE